MSLPHMEASNLTLLLNARSDSPACSSDELLPLVYDELRRMAAERMSDELRERTLQPTALVHEAWLRLHRGRHQQWNDRFHFFRVAVRTMRRILVDRARQRSSLRHCEGAGRVNIADIDLAAATPDDRVLLVNSALDELRKLDPEGARVVELKFFGGFSNKEVAWMTKVSERTVERQWAYAKAMVYQLLEELDR